MENNNMLTTKQTKQKYRYVLKDKDGKVIDYFRYKHPFYETYMVYRKSEEYIWEDVSEEESERLTNKEKEK